MSKSLIVGFILFIIFINELDDLTAHSLRKIGDDDNITDARTSVQRHTDRLKSGQQQKQEEQSSMQSGARLIISMD